MSRLLSKKERAYLKAEKKLEKELNIVNVIQQLRLVNEVLPVLIDAAMLKRLKAKSKYKVIQQENGKVEPVSGELSNANLQGAQLEPVSSPRVLQETLSFRSIEHRDILHP